MFRKIAVAGATAAAIVGVGTAALATTGSDNTAGTGKATAGHSTAAKKHKNPVAAAVRRGVHGQITTKSKNGYVTHSGIRGTVTAVSATSITVKAADGYTQTFTIAKATKVRQRPASGNGKGTAAKVADVKSGDKVGVVGKVAEKSSAKPTATVVVDGLKK